MVHVDDYCWFSIGKHQRLARFLSQAKVSLLRRNHLRCLVSRDCLTEICYNTEKSVGGPPWSCISRPHLAKCCICHVSVNLLFLCSHLSNTFCFTFLVNLVPKPRSTNVSSFHDNDIFTIRNAVRVQDIPSWCLCPLLEWIWQKSYICEKQGLSVFVWWSEFWVTLLKSIFHVPWFPLSVAIISLSCQQILSKMDGAFILSNRGRDSDFT